MDENRLFDKMKEHDAALLIEEHRRIRNAFDAYLAKKEGLVR